jgi:type I restriction enzyme S subunit
MKFDEDVLYFINTDLQGKRISLFDLANWKNGLAFRKIDFSETGEPVIKIAELNNGITGTTAFTDKQYSPEVHLTKGDLVFSWSGNPQTSIDTYWYDLPDGWLNQHIFKVTPDELEIDKYFLFYLMKYLKPTFTAIATNKQTTGLGHVTIADLKRLNVIVPEREIQKRIAGVLKAIDDKVYVNNEINKNLEQQMYAFYQELFVTNSDPQWKYGTIADLGSVIGGSTPSKKRPEYYTEKGIAWITPKDLSNDHSKFISHGENDITDLGLANSSAVKMSAGTVLFSSRAPIGYIAIAANTVTTNQGFKSVVPYEDIGTAFVYYFLKDNLVTIENMASGSTFKEVSGSTMKSVPAFVPDADSLREFNNFCKPLFEEQQNLEDENRQLSQLRDALLPRLMSGELDVSDIDL